MRTFKGQDFLFFLSTLPNVKVKQMKKSGTWRVWYKPNSRYAHSWDIWNYVRKAYEVQTKTLLPPSEVCLMVFEKYIEIG